MPTHPSKECVRRTVEGDQKFVRPAITRPQSVTAVVRCCTCTWLSYSSTIQPTRAAGRAMLSILINRHASLAVAEGGALPGDCHGLSLTHGRLRFRGDACTLELSSNEYIRSAAPLPHYPASPQLLP